MKTMKMMRLKTAAQKKKSTALERRVEAVEAEVNMMCKHWTLGRMSELV